MDNIIEFKKKKVSEYPVQNEVYQRLKSIILEYDGDISLSTVLGVLRIIDHELISDNE